MFITKKYTTILLLLILPILLFSQNSQFKKILKNNTEKFNTNSEYLKAQTFFIEDEWDSTLVYTAKLLSIKTINTELADYCHFLRGLSLREKEIYDEAENEFSKVSKNFVFAYNIKSVLGSIALEQENFKKAIAYLKAVDELKTENLLGIKKGNIKHNIGLCYMHLEEYELAEVYLQKSIIQHEQQKDTLELISTYGNIANLYYIQYKDAQAIPYFKKAYELAQTTNDLSSKKITAKNMAIVEKNQKNYLQAFKHFDEYDLYKDTINDQNKIYAVAQIEKQIAIKDTQNKVILLKAENKVKNAQRKTYLYTAIILSLLLAISFYFYREKVKRNKIINHQKENLDELNTTKDKLFSIVSHDLRSSVNAIKISNKKLVDKLETENLNEVNSLLQNNSAIVNGAYNLLDNLLNWALLQTKQTFFKISKLRLAAISEHVIYNYKAILADKNITFKNSISKKDIVYADKESLKIIIRNLIDNAIKFTNSGGTIRMYSNNEHADFCDLIIEDTGIGMDAETREELLKETALLSKKKHEDIIGTGLGMQLCKSMIKKNNGIFSIKSELGKGTKMIISLPKNLPNEPN